jgi:outer membrane protein assembly factor BamB
VVVELLLRLLVGLDPEWPFVGQYRECTAGGMGADMGEATSGDRARRPQSPHDGGGIFLSYRRDETEHVAGRLADRLASVFGDQRVFIDVDSIRPGSDFVAAIQQAVRRCDVLLALIGPSWTAATDRKGRRRLDDPEDFVVLEIREALLRDVHVLPILVDGARMPSREELPADLQALVRRNAVRVDGESFRSDVAALVEHLLAVLPESPGGQEPGTLITRRTLLLAAAGVGAATLAGTGGWVVKERLDRVPEPLWVFGTDGEVYSSPAVVEDVLYIGSTDEHLYALEARTGALLWAYRTGGAVTSSPAVAGGTVYVGSNDASLHAVEAGSGRRLWTFETGGALHSSPALDEGSVYIGSRDNTLYAVDRTSGERRWAFRGGQHEDVVVGFNSSPLVVDGTVYVGCRDHNVYAVDTDRGEQLWRRTTASTVDSSPTVAGGSVFIGSDDHALWALRVGDGSVIWTYPTDGGITSTPAFTGGVVYVGSDDGHLHAVDASTGRGRWKQPTAGSIRSSPVVHAGLVTVGSRDFALHTFDAVLGEPRWSFRTRGPIDDSSPAVAAGRVFVGSLDGNVYAVDAERGARL